MAPPDATPDATVTNSTVDALDSSGWTPLQRAAMSGTLPEIEKLLAAGANLEASNPKVYDGATPFVIALHFSHAEAAQLLLDRGASIAGKLGTDALALSARDGEDALVKQLLARKVPLAGSRALHLAARYGRTSSIKLLLAAGATIDEPDRDDHDFTPLIWTCIENHLEAAKVLLAAGAKLNLADTEGSTALHWAVYGAKPIEKHLYRDLRKPHDTIFTPQQAAPLVTLLIAKGAKVNLVDKQGDTPLHQAAMLDSAAAATALLRGGANKTLRNAEGKTPYQLAKDRNNSVEPILR